MYFVNLLVWFICLVNSTIITATDENFANGMEILRNQVNQILVEFCAFEIDRNRTASAIAKFNQLSNVEGSLKNVVQFYNDNYEDRFDNLLYFINQLSSYELRHTAYNTLNDLIDTDHLNLVNVLRFENFIRNKFDITEVDDNDRKIYEKCFITITKNIKKSIITTDLNEIVKYANSSNDPESIYELVPALVQGVDVNNFSDMNKVFEFSTQLPIINQLKLMRKVLSEIRNGAQYTHIFHVIREIKLMRDSIDADRWQIEIACLLNDIEKEIPSKFLHLMERYETYNVKNLATNEYLYFVETKNCKQNLFLFHNEKSQSWSFKTWRKQKSVSIVASPTTYLSVEHCYNISIPTAKDYDKNDPTQFNWYLVWNEDLDSFQIKNTYTNEFLIADDVQELTNDVLRRPVTLSTSCLHNNHSCSIYH